jgi:hypothetical protein
MHTGKKDNSMKAKYQKGGRLTKRRDKLTGKLDTLNSKVGTKFVRGNTGPTGVTTENHIEVPDYTKKSQKRKSKNLTKRIDKLGNRIYKKANKKKFTPVTKKALNAFLQKGGEKETPRYWNTAFDHEKTTRSANLKPPLYNEYKGNTKTVRYKESDNVEGGSNTYTQPPAGTTYNKYTDSSEMPKDSKKMKKTKNQFPIDRRKGGKRYQTGGGRKLKTKQRGGFFESDEDQKARYDKMTQAFKDGLVKEDREEKAAVAKAKKNKTDAAKSAASAKSAGATWRTAVGAERPSGGDKEAKMKLAIAQDRRVNYNKSKPDYPLRKQKGGLTQGKGKVSTSGKSKKINPNAKTPVDPRPSDEMTFLPPGTRGKKQKGGKVKPSLQYNPNYPTTQNKPSPHSKLKLDKAIARDSTSIANRWPIADFFDDGTENSTSRKLQVNREYRDKVNNADSKTTAKKINKMKNKKQMGGSIAERMRNAKGPTPPKKMTGQETKDLGKKKLAAGRANRRTARGIDGGAKSVVKSIARGQRQEGRGLKSKGRKMKRSDRQDKKEAEVERTRSWLQTGGSKEVIFGAPSTTQKSGYKQTKYKKDGTLKKHKSISEKKFNRVSKRYSGQKGSKTLGTNTSQRQQVIAGGNGPRKFVSRKGMQSGGAINKKFLGGLMGAVGGMKGAEGGFGKKLMGAAKGALGGGMLGRVAGGIKGAMGGGGLKGAMAGIKGGAFGNSNPMAQQQGAEQAQGADPAMAAEAAAQQMAQRGGVRRKAKREYKKGLRKRKRNSGKIYGNQNSNCFKGDC